MAESYQWLQIDLSKCYGHEHCKKPEEIEAFIEGLQVYVFYNSQDYKPDGYGSESVLNRNEFFYKQMDPKTPKVYIFDV